LLADEKIGLVLLSFGTSGMVLSMVYGSSVLAFISLTLALWGLLFLRVLPAKYVKSEVMDCMTSSSLSAINQIIEDSKVQGRAIYIPVPRELYLPYTLGVRNEFVFISKRNVNIETALEHALMRKPRGLRLIPPGLALANLMEKRTNLDFHNLDLNSITEILPSIIAHDLEMTHEFKISRKENEVHTEAREPICRDLCKEVSNMQYLCSNVGCPLSSSIACILTRVTNKPITIERCITRNNTIETSFQIL